MTFEQRIEFVEKIRENPEMLDALKRRLIEIKEARERGVSGIQAED